MSRTANDEQSKEAEGWRQARNQLFQMIMEGRSFSGRERNCCFLNTGQERFATISAASGFDFLDDGRAIAVTDWDGDGDEDLWVSNRNAPRIRFMRNNNATNNRFIALGLLGNGRTTNRDAIGARVEVVLHNPDGTELPLAKTLRAGEGFLAQSSKWLHFGLGDAGVVDRVVVHWPGGDSQSFQGLDVNGRYVLSQGEPKAVRQAANTTRSRLYPVGQSLPTSSRAARIPLQSRLPMPSIRYTEPSGSVTERFERGRPTVVNLWASWCAPCAKELVDLTSQASELSAAGLHVISLCVDQLDQPPKSGSDAAALLKRIDYPYSWGYIDSTQMNRIQWLHNHLFFLRRPLPLPTSLLIDEVGRLAVVYRGPVSVPQLLTDLQPPPDGYQQSIEHAACLPGSAILHERVEAVAAMGERQARYLIAAGLERDGLLDDAREHFQLLVETNPSWAVALRHLARLHLRQGSLSEASTFARRAIQADPREARGHNTMALIYSEQQNLEDAMLHFRKAIQLNAEFAEAHNNLGTVLATRGDIAGAQRCFQKALALDQDFAEAYTNLGSAYAAQRQISKAMEQYRKAIQVDPTYVDAHNNLGSMLGSQGKLKQAIDCYRRALELDAANQEARRNLQRALDLLRARRPPNGTNSR